MASIRRISKTWRVPDELWKYMEALLPGRNGNLTMGRPSLKMRDVADGIFYVLRTGCQWKAAPREFGSGSALHKYFQLWVEAGVFWKLWQQGLLEYEEVEGIKWDWQSIDGSMTKAPLGGEKNRAQSHRPSQERGETKPAYRWRRRPSGTDYGCSKRA